MHAFKPSSLWYTASTMNIKPKPKYVDVTNEVAAKTKAKSVFLLVFEGNEGNGMCRWRGPRGSRVEQEVSDNRFIAQSLRQLADHLDKEADILTKQGKGPTS